MRPAPGFLLGGVLTPLSSMRGFSAVDPRFLPFPQHRVSGNLTMGSARSRKVPVEEVQHLVGHSHPSTIQLYDRRRRRINRSIVERIPF